MKLSLLLFFLAAQLKHALRTRPSFRRHVGNVQLRILVKTADDRHGRVFVFDHGRVASRRGARHAANAALVWSDPATAFRVMRSRSDRASFLAAAEGRLRIDGMAAYAQWFTDAVKLAV